MSAIPVITVIEREKVNLLNDLHRQCQQAYGRTLELAIDAGNVLISIKLSLKHGEFGTWLAEHFEGSERTAQVYMQLASAPEITKAQTSADLSIASALRQVAKPREPKMSPGEMGDVFRTAGVTHQLTESGPEPQRRQTDPPARQVPDRKDRRAAELLDEIRAAYDDAHHPSLTTTARARVYRDAAVSATHLAALLDEIAIALGG